MLLSFIEKLKGFPKIYYVLFIFVLIMLLVFLLFVLINNKLNRRALLIKPKSSVKDIYILEILLKNNEVKIYSKKNYNRLYKYTIAQWTDLIHYNNLDEWENWIESILSGKNIIQHHLYIRAINPENSKLSLIRINFDQYNKEKESIYCNFEIIEVEQKTNLLSVPSLINPNEFKTKIIENINDSKEPVGVFMIFELSTIKLIKNRYSLNISNDCLFEIMRRFKELIDDNTYISYFGTNSFYLYKKGIKNRIGAIEYMKEVYELIASEPISINKYIISPHFNVGISIFGEYTFDINELFRNAKLALTQGNNKYEKIKYGYYDYINETVNIKYRQNVEKLRQFIYSENFDLFFETFVSLTSLSVHGYYARFDQSFNEEDGFPTYLQIAKNLKLKDEFITKFFITMLNKCDKEMSKRVRVYAKVNVEDLELVKNIILSNKEFLNIRLVLVVDYEQVIKEENAAIVRRIHEELSSYSNIEYGLVADENMITVYSNVLNICNYIILDEFMLTNVEVDDIKKITLENIIDNTTAFSGVQFIARGVAKYEQAITLQKMGIGAISGPYVLEPTSNISNEEFLKNRTIQRLYEHE